MASKREPDAQRDWLCDQCGIALQDAGECGDCGLCADCCQCETEDTTGLEPLAVSGTFDMDEFGEEPEDEFERRTR